MAALLPVLAHRDISLHCRFGRYRGIADFGERSRRKPASQRGRFCSLRIRPMASLFLIGRGCSGRLLRQGLRLRRGGRAPKL
jgi:hypothetical protein